MNRYSLTHVPGPILLRDLRALLSQERAATAELLAHLAEVDDRRLYAPAGHPSMFAYCIEELHLSEDSACNRIRAARAARQFPAVFGMLADGRLHLSAIVTLAPYLTPENADGLLAASAHQTKAGIEQLLAERFPRPDLPARVGALAPSQTIDLSVPGRIDNSAPRDLLTSGPSGTAPPDELSAPGRMTPCEQPPAGTVRPRVAPLAPGRYALQLTLSQDTYETLRYAQALLGHAVPSNDLAEVFDRALKALVARLEQRKFAATSRPRTRQQRVSTNTRHVPSEVRRAVWERDGGRCTFVSETGRRCPARTRLEFDHVEPVARGGRATVDGMRLRCRAHNQYAAEQAFGAGFMSRKRAAAQRETKEARDRAAATAEEARRRAAVAREEARSRAAAVAEVVPWLRALGLRADEARLAATRCEAIPKAPLERRVRHALSCFARPSQRSGLPGPRPAT